MAGDSLRELLALARKDMPDVPDAIWQRFERLTRQNFGTQRLYIAAHRKTQLLEALAKEQEGQSLAELGKKLGCSGVRIHQLKKLG